MDFSWPVANKEIFYFPDVSSVSDVTSDFHFSLLYLKATFIGL